MTPLDRAQRDYDAVRAARLRAEGADIAEVARRCFLSVAQARAAVVRGRQLLAADPDAERRATVAYVDQLGAGMDALASMLGATEAEALRGVLAGIRQDADSAERPSRLPNAMQPNAAGISTTREVRGLDG